MCDTSYGLVWVAQQIQSVVDDIGEPLYVVGGATRRANFNDIDYAADFYDAWNAYHQAWDEGRLPRMNPNAPPNVNKLVHGPFPIDMDSPLDFNQGIIEFRPRQTPQYYPPTRR